MADAGSQHDPSLLTIVVAGIFALLARLAGPVFTWLTGRKASRHGHKHAHPHPRKRDEDAADD